MLKYYINPWIVTRTYFFSQNKNESLSFIENLKTGLYYILKGAISDLWNVIHSVEDLNEVETYAIKNNMQKVLTEFLNELSTLDIIKMQNDCFTTKLNSAKYLKNVISDSSPNFNYFVKIMWSTSVTP